MSFPKTCQTPCVLNTATPYRRRAVVAAKIQRITRKAEKGLRYLFIVSDIRIKAYTTSKKLILFTVPVKTACCRKNTITDCSDQAIISIMCQLEKNTFLQKGACKKKLSV